MFTSFMRKRASNNLLSEAIRGLDVHVEAIMAELRLLAKGVRLTLTENERAIQYRSADEVWRFYKGVRDQDDFLLAFFALATFMKLYAEWKLLDPVAPSSALFKDFKRTKLRVRRLQDEVNICIDGMKYLLLSKCIGEDICSAEPLAGNIDKYPLVKDSPSAKFLTDRFHKKFKLIFDPVKYAAEFPILGAVSSLDHRNMSVGLDNYLSLDLDILMPSWSSTKPFENLPVATPVGEKAPVIANIQTKQGSVRMYKSLRTFRFPSTRQPKESKEEPNVTLQKGLELALPVNMLDVEFRLENYTIERKKYMMLRVRADCHVLFRALSHCLSDGKSSFQTEVRDIFTLRELAAQHIVKNMNEPIMSDGTTVKQEVLIASPVDCTIVGEVSAFTAYYKKLLYRKRAADLELWALSHALKKKLTVFEKALVGPKAYASFLKHVASYGVNYEEELLLYRNGKGDFVSLIPREQNSKVHATFAQEDAMSETGDVVNEAEFEEIEAEDAIKELGRMEDPLVDEI